MYREQSLPIINPATGERLGTVPVVSPEEVPGAVHAGRKAFVEWCQVPLAERLKALGCLRQCILDNIDVIVDKICINTGKTRMDALTAEILSTVDIIKFYEQHAPVFLSKQKVKTPWLLWGKKSYVEYKPMGVVAVIAPWNYPFNLAVVPAISALAAGNVVILKPSEVAPLVGLLVEDLFRQAAFPSGVIQVLHGGGEVGQALVQAGPDKIFFTGSAATGKQIMAAAAEQLIPVQLELGGKDAMVVLADAPLERSVNGVLWGGFTNSGQVCMAVERLYVEADVYSEFLDRLLARINTLRQGSGKDGELGHMTDPRQLEVIDAHLRDAVAKGAKIICGGLPSDAADSMLVPPTVVVDVDHSMKLMREETFGPIIAVMEFKDRNEVVELVNDSEYGLSTSIWTRDLNQAQAVASQLITGNVVVNDIMVNFANPYLPFGGVKSSGMGEYHAAEGLYAFCHATSVIVDRGIRVNELQWYPYSAEKYEHFKNLIRSLYGRSSKLLQAVVSAVRLYTYKP
ncbi:MAG: aldehyde dehydrogenase family protein [Syntrophomonadaceae bacterium]|nr:aldehyde dehydrogenase family protein [Syntrophomonadaceae bacterium]